MDKIEKLVHMYSNERILAHIESNDDEGSMSIWMYDYDDQEEDGFDVERATIIDDEIQLNLVVLRMKFMYILSVRYNVSLNLIH